MRILFVCHRFPYPPARGGKIRPFNMIRHLARKHEVVVASLARSAAEAAAGRGIADHCADFMMGRVNAAGAWGRMIARRSEEHTSELQSLMRISYAVFCLKKKQKV